MNKNQINKMMAEEAQATNDFDNYNTTVKIHTVTMEGNVATLDEMRSGHIKVNGTEQFTNYAEMIECLAVGAKIETKEV